MSARAAAAPSESRVALALPSCEPADFSRADLRAAVALELGTSGLVLAPDAEPGAEPDVRAALDTTCEHGASIALRAAWHGKSGERSLRVDELPRAARPRALALALAELLAGLRSPDDVPPENVELAESTPASTDHESAPPASTSASAAPPPAPSATKPRAPPGAAEHAAPAPGTVDDHDRATLARTRASRHAVTPRHALAVSPEFRSFEFQTNTAGVRARYDFGDWGLGVATLFGHESGSLGVASALIVHGFLERRVTLLGHPDGPWLTLGPRAGIGVVEVHSTANPGALDTTVAEPYLDLASFLEFSTDAGLFRFGLRAELGYALGLIALEDDRRLASYAGPFGGVLLDVRCAL